MGGKTRSGLSLTRPGPPTPFFVGEGDEKRKGGKTCSRSLLPKSPRKKQVTTRHLEGRGGTQVPAGWGRVAPPLTSAPSALGVQSEAQACELEELSARMRAVDARFPPLS